MTKVIGGQNSPPVFQSKYGNTTLWNEPSVGVSIWGRWFPLNQTFLQENTLSNKMVDELRGTIYGMQNIFAAPFIGKWQGFNSVSKVIDDVFPNCFFVRVKRDYTSVAQSILKARKDSGNENTWFSSKTSAYDKIIASTHDPIRQVCLQIYHLEKDLDDFFTTVKQNRKTTIDYSDACKNPIKSIKNILHKYNQYNKKFIEINLKKIPTEFTPSNRKKVSTSDEEKIVRTLAEL